jgi:1,4-alpha-glucan branching enzyme
VLSFVRQTSDHRSVLLVVMNLTPVFRYSYRIGLPDSGFWREALNSDAEIYGGSNKGNLGGVQAEELRMHNQPYSAALVLPPLSILVFKRERG